MQLLTIPREYLPYYAQPADSVDCLTCVAALTWSQSGKLVSCGYKRMFYGWFIRFIVGPVIMVITSLAFGLKGISFEFSVLQVSSRSPSEVIFDRIVLLNFFQVCSSEFKDDNNSWTCFHLTGCTPGGTGVLRFGQGIQA